MEHKEGKSTLLQCQTEKIIPKIECTALIDAIERHGEVNLSTWWQWWEHHKVIAMYFFFFFSHNVSLHHLCFSGTNTFIWVEACRFPNPFLSFQNLHTFSCRCVKELHSWIAVAVAHCLISVPFHICAPWIRNLLSLLTYLNRSRETYEGVSCKGAWYFFLKCRSLVCNKTTLIEKSEAKSPPWKGKVIFPCHHLNPSSIIFITCKRKTIPVFFPKASLDPAH